MKLICFPHAGGFAYYFDFFRTFEFKNIDEVYSYEYPGRGTRNNELEEHDFHERVNNALDFLLSLNLENEEYILFGHSMGSFVAYELGLVLQNEYHLPPRYVFMSGQNPPCTFMEIKDFFDPTKVDPEAFCEKLGGIPEYIRNNRQVIDYYRTIIESDMSVLATYCPVMPELDKRLKRGVFLYGSEDSILFRDKFNKWRYNVEDICEERIFDGGHFYIDKYKKEISEMVDRYADK